MKNELLNKAKNSLNSKELAIFKLMLPKSGVPFLKGKPGIGKSAIVNSIAKKLDFQYIDLRLSQMDETDMGLFPTISEKNGHKYVEHALPEWATMANDRPTIIHFEELNRASLSVRNAALQILNERMIGYKFKFNENVYMVASGNQGEQDGTDVEEFDNALKTRLITKIYDVDLKEWIQMFAKDNVNNLIVRYLESKPNEFYKFVEGEETYATPRGWTFLSNYISINVENENDPKSILDEVYSCIQSYVGPSGTGFLRFLEDASLITIKDILNRYSEVEKQVEQLGMVKKTELIEDLKGMKWKFTEKQVENIKKFMVNVEQDQLSGYLIHLLDNNSTDDIIKNETLRSFLQTYKETLKKIKK